MRTVSPLVLCGLLVVGISLGVLVEERARSPVFVVDSTTVYLGRAIVGQGVRHVVTVENGGKAELRLAVTGSTCP